MYQLNNSVAVWRDLSLIYTILTATDHADSLAASSRLSGLQQKTPDDRTWYDGVVARWADDDLQSGADDELGMAQMISEAAKKNT